MKPRVDLDDLARRLESAVADWSKVAEVGPFMWHDRTADDQRRVTLERASVAIPEALSFTLRRPMDYDTEVTVRAAGWIDVLLGGETYVPGPRVRGAKAACRAVIAEVEDFLY